MDTKQALKYAFLASASFFLGRKSARIAQDNDLLKISGNLRNAGVPEDEIAKFMELLPGLPDNIIQACSDADTMSEMLREAMVSIDPNLKNQALQKLDLVEEKHKGYGTYLRVFSDSLFHDSRRAKLYAAITKLSVNEIVEKLKAVETINGSLDGAYELMIRTFKVEWTPAQQRAYDATTKDLR